MEIIDIVNKKDKVIGSTTKEEIYKQKLLHRIVHVLIFNKNGDLALQLRSKQCQFRPLHWSTTVGGHVISGETYKQAALREMREEIGLNLPLKKLGKYFYSDGKAPDKILTVYNAVYEGNFDLEDKLLKVEYFSIKEIKKKISKKEKFHPELIFLIDKLFIF